jgi:hypothetical protein
MLQLLVHFHENPSNEKFLNHVRRFRKKRRPIYVQARSLVNSFYLHTVRLIHSAVNRSRGRHV